MSGGAAAEPPYSIAGEAREEFASGEAASEIGNSTRLFTNPLTASSLAFTALQPKQMHSRAKSHQLRRLMTSLISSLTVKLFLYLFVSERWYIINTSWGMPRKSSANLRLSNLWTFLESIRKCSCALRTIFGESSEIFRQWLEIFGNRLKRYQYVCKIKK